MHVRVMLRNNSTLLGDEMGDHLDNVGTSPLNRLSLWVGYKVSTVLKAIPTVSILGGYVTSTPPIYSTQIGHSTLG